jgi:Lar family restriction alleviation protein
MRLLESAIARGCVFLFGLKAEVSNEVLMKLEQKGFDVFEAVETDKTSDCPFCGSSEVVIFIGKRRAGGKRWQVECVDCGSRGPNGYTPQSAVQMWNFRASET